MVFISISMLAPPHLQLIRCVGEGRKVGLLLYLIGSGSQWGDISSPVFVSLHSHTDMTDGVLVQRAVQLFIQAKNPLTACFPQWAEAAASRSADPDRKSNCWYLPMWDHLWILQWLTCGALVGLSCDPPPPPDPIPADNQGQGSFPLTLQFPCLNVAPASGFPPGEVAQAPPDCTIRVSMCTTARCCARTPVRLMFGGSTVDVASF